MPSILILLFMNSSRSTIGEDSILNQAIPGKDWTIER